MAGQNFPGLMNPGISANGLFLAGVEADDGKLIRRPPKDGDPPDSNAAPGKGETYGTGLSVQEMEVQLVSVVDPYFKANLVLSLPGGEGIAVEEGFVTLTSIPRVLVNIGKIKEPFGRENPTHTHAFLTIDKSLVGQAVFGGEGLNDMGVNAAILLPTPWYSEITLGVDAGNNDVVMGSGDPLGIGTMAHWKNQFDLSSGTSAELGLSGLTGLDAFAGRSTVGGVDLTLKSHGHARHQYNRVIWQSELMYRDVGGAGDAAKLGGLYSDLDYSLSHRVWIGGRFDYVGFGAPQTYGATLIGVLAPTEFSAFRLQAQRQFLPDGHTADSIVGQLNFTIGLHPAHSY